MMAITRSMTRQFSTINKQQLQIQDNRYHNVLVMRLNSESATVHYRKRGNVYVMTESNIPDKYRGKGYGSILAKKAFDFVVKNNGKMMLECTFLRKVYEQNKKQYNKYIEE